MHLPFKKLQHEGCSFLLGGLVPFGTFPFQAPFPSLLTLLGDRGPGEGERVRSRLPVPFLLMSCLKVHESPLEHCPFTNH